MSSPKVHSANKVKGTLIKSFDNKYYFRVYSDDGFKDYVIGHSDLQIIIDDEDAEFYEYDTGNLYLDHSRKTLGKL